MGDDPSLGCDYEESDPPCIDVTLGEVSVYVQGASRETLEDIVPTFDDKYKNALEDYCEITDADEDTKGWN